MVTLAPGTGAPLASRTVPSMTPVVACDWAETAGARASARSAMRAVDRISLDICLLRRTRTVCSRTICRREVAGKGQVGAAQRVEGGGGGVYIGRPWYLPP